MLKSTVGTRARLRLEDMEEGFKRHQHMYSRSTDSLLASLSEYSGPLCA